MCWILVFIFVYFCFVSLFCSLTVWWHRKIPSLMNNLIRDGLARNQIKIIHSFIQAPDVSGQVPCMSPNMFPQALDTAAIFASTGRLWMTNETSLRCCLANVWAWPRMPNPVMSVAAWALKVCMRPAAAMEHRENLHSKDFCVINWCSNEGWSAEYVLNHRL